MNGRFADRHGSLGVPDGFGELAELREHVGELGLRKRRLDAGSPEALVAQIALEGNVSLEEGGRMAKLAPGRVCPAQKGRGRHLDRTIAKGPRDAQGLMPEADGARVVRIGTINATSAKRPARSGLPPKPALAAEAARLEGRGRAATSRAPADPASSCAGAGRTVKEQAEGAGPGPGERDPARVWPSGEATRSRPGRGQAPPGRARARPGRGGSARRPGPARWR